MKIYCGDYMSYKPPRRYRWARLGVLVACLLFTSAATPAMINYYWNGQNSTYTLELETAFRLTKDEEAPVHERKSAQSIVFVTAKTAIEALQAPKDDHALNMHSAEYLKKLTALMERTR